MALGRYKKNKKIDIYMTFIDWAPYPWHLAETHKKNNARRHKKQAREIAYLGPALGAGTYILHSGQRLPEWH